MIAKCTEVRAQLTAYLDGEIDDDRGSAIRGHLRGCDACRAAAGDEATLRDGLRHLPPIEPPASLWAGVQRQLAAAEVADSERPRWRRAISRWWAMAPAIAPRLAFAVAVAAVAVVVLVWKSGHHVPDVQPVARHDNDIIKPPQPAPAPAHAPVPEVGDRDVTAELAGDAARVTASYTDTTDELVRVAMDSRTRWSDDRKQLFDAKLASLRHDIDAAIEGRPRQKAYRVLIRYLQKVTIDDVALAEVRP